MLLLLEMLPNQGLFWKQEEVYGVDRRGKAAAMDLHKLFGDQTRKEVTISYNKI